MLFFKQITDEKLSDPAFRNFYQQECHICSVTLEVIRKIEDMIEQGKKKEADTLLAAANVQIQEYGELREGDRCRPEQVFALCRALNIDTSREKPCPHLKSDQ